MRRLAVVVAGLGLLAGGVAVTGIDSTAGPTEARAAEALAADDSALSVSSASEPAGAPSTVSVVLTPMAQGEASATLMRAGDAPVRYAELAPGPYVLTASVSTPNVDLTSLACQPATAVQSLDLSTGSVLLEVGEADDVTCAVSTEQRGEIVVRHRTRPAGGRSFEYDTSWGQNLALRHSTTKQSPALVAGTYSVVPDVPRGWDLAKATCSDGSEPADVEVAPGESVQCTFVAARRGRIVAKSETEPVSSARRFAVDVSWGDTATVSAGVRHVSPALKPGTYSVSPQEQRGWDQSVTCSDGSRPREVSLAPGERVTCTVRSVQRGRIVVVNEPDAATADPLTVDPSWTASFSLGSGESKRSRPLAPGTYSVSVEHAPGWAPTGESCDDGSAPGQVSVSPGETVTCTFTSTQPEFTVASFNVLGHSHTQPGGRVPAYASGPSRMATTVGILRARGVDVVGFQELQRPQMDAFVRQTGGDFAIFPTPGDRQRNKQNAVAWRTSEFTLVDARTVPMPYFKGNRVPKPLVKLRHNDTGLEMYVMTVHNPASVRRVGDQSRWRAAATAQQIGLTRQLLAEGVPVLMTGDMNERERYFCAYTASGQMKAAAGGSNDGACRPPPASLARIDWVFGSNDVEFTGYELIRTPDVRRSSDHPLVLAEARLL